MLSTIPLKGPGTTFCWNDIRRPSFTLRLFLGSTRLSWCLDAGDLVIVRVRHELAAPVVTDTVGIDELRVLPGRDSMQAIAIAVMEFNLHQPGERVEGDFLNGVRGNVALFHRVYE